MTFNTSLLKDFKWPEMSGSQIITFHTTASWLSNHRSYMYHPACSLESSILKTTKQKYPWRGRNKELSRSFLTATNWHWHTSNPAKFLERWTQFRKMKMKQLLPEHKVRTIDFSSTAGIFQNACISNHSTVFEGIDWKRRGLQTNKKIQPILYKCFDCFLVSTCSCRFNLVNPSESIHHLVDKIAKPGHQEPKIGTKRHSAIRTLRE